MQDILFFRVVTIYISLRCILLHLCRDVRITLSVVLFGLVTRTLRHRVLVWRFCFTVCFPPVILRILPWLSSAAFGCWPSSIALSKHTGVRNCCSVFSIFPYPFPAFLPSPHARFSKFYFSFNKLFFKNIPAPDESATAAFPAIKSGFGVVSCIIRFNPLRKSNILSFQQTHFSKHTCYIYILKQKLL